MHYLPYFSELGQFSPFQDYHRLGHADFTRLYPNFRVRKETTPCMVCGQLMTFDLGKMRVHMMKFHPEMTLR